MKKVTRNERRIRIKKAIAKRLTGTTERPRLSIFRSNTNIYAQIIDDTTQTTLTAVSSLSKELEADVKGKNPTEVSKAVGLAIAKKAKEAKIEKVVFDRNGYLYHGRIKAIADGAREGGLQF